MKRFSRRRFHEQVEMIASVGAPVNAYFPAVGGAGFEFLETDLRAGPKHRECAACAVGTEDKVDRAFGIQGAREFAAALPEGAAVFFAGLVVRAEIEFGLLLSHGLVVFYLAFWI